MGKAIIFQILGVTMYDVVNYFVDGTVYRSTLASTALASDLRKKGFKVEIVFLLPDSAVISSVEELKESLGGLREKAIEFVWEHAGVGDDFSVEVFWSIGQYSIGEEKRQIKLNNCIGNVVARFFEVLVKYAEDKDLDLYFVTTTGLNIYVTAFIDALRYFIVNQKLRCMLQRDKTKTSAFLVFHEPIFRGVKEANLTIEPYDVRTFFSIPYSNYQQDPALVSSGAIRTERGAILRDFKQQLRTLIIKTKLYIRLLNILYNAIYNNTPLAFAYFDEIYNGIFRDKKIRQPVESLHMSVDTHAKQLLRETINYVKANEETTNNQISYYCINHRDLLNIYLSMSLLYSIIKFQNNNIKQIIQNDINNKKKYADLEKLKETFTKLYDDLKLKLNKRFLKRDINEILKRTENLEENKEILLKDLKQQNQNNKKQNQEEDKEQEKQTKILISDPKRNFYAHSGLPYNETIILKHKKRVYARYKQKFIKEKLISMLEKPD